MLEVPKSAWERNAPGFLAAIVLVVLAIGGGIAAWPYLKPEARREAPAPVLTGAQAETVALLALPEDSAPQGQWIEWRSDHPTSSFTIAGYEFSFSPVVRQDLNAPRMVVASPSGIPSTIEGSALSWDAAASFAVVQLDTSSPERQILFSSFSGGAHCCTSLTLLEFTEGAWRRTELGLWDGDTPALPADIDGDGRKEFRFVDQSFLYTFESYAGSWAPPVIHEVRDGRVTDVSDARRFRSIYEAYVPQARQACAETQNGACAAYVAAAARLGQLDAAWSIMLASYDEYASWTYPSACRVRTSGECPTDAAWRFETFPESLQWFLGEAGYTEASYVPPLNEGGPSFSCGAASKQSEHLICASPELSRMDMVMAALYTRAIALTPNRAALRASQREFLTYRDDLLNELSLTAAYRARINQLSAI